MENPIHSHIGLIVAGSIVFFILPILILCICFFDIDSASVPVSPLETEEPEVQASTDFSENEPTVSINSETLSLQESTPSAAFPKESEVSLDFSLSDLKWNCVSEQVPDSYSMNQSYLVWIPDIEGPKDVLVMMHSSHNPVESTGFPSDWIKHTYWDCGCTWDIGDALASMAKDHPFILVSPNYTCWADKYIHSDTAETDFLKPEIHIKFLKDVCSKFSTYAEPTEESIEENRSHFFLGGGSLGGNWTSQGIVSGLSSYYGNFVIASDSTQQQMSLDKLIKSLHKINAPTNVWCVNGSLEGAHTFCTWAHIKDEDFAHVHARHILVLEGNHRYTTWIAGLNKILLAE